MPSFFFVHLLPIHHVMYFKKPSLLQSLTLHLKIGNICWNELYYHYIYSFRTTFETNSSFNSYFTLFFFFPTRYLFQKTVSRHYIMIILSIYDHRYIFPKLNCFFRYFPDQLLSFLYFKEFFFLICLLPDLSRKKEKFPRAPKEQKIPYYQKTKISKLKQLNHT